MLTRPGMFAFFNSLMEGTIWAQRANCWCWNFNCSSRRCVERGSLFYNLQITFSGSFLTRDQLWSQLLDLFKRCWSSDSWKPGIVLGSFPGEDLIKRKTGLQVSKRRQAWKSKFTLVNGCCPILICLRENLRDSSQCFEDLALCHCIAYLLPHSNHIKT